MRQKLRWVERGSALLRGCAGDALCSFQGISLPSGAAAHRNVQLFSVSCVLHVWLQPLFTAGPKHCTELSMTVPAPRVSYLVFSAFAASPRAADMGGGESWLMGEGESEGAEDVTAVLCLLIFAGGGRDAAFGMSAHPGCVHSPLFSWKCTVRGQGDGIMWLCNLLVKMF